MGRPTPTGCIFDRFRRIQAISLQSFSATAVDEKTPIFIGSNGHRASRPDRSARACPKMAPARTPPYKTREKMCAPSPRFAAARIHTI